MWWPTATCSSLSSTCKSLSQIHSRVATSTSAGDVGMHRGRDTMGIFLINRKHPPA
jgi:hypothetical protein